MGGTERWVQGVVEVSCGGAVFELPIHGGKRFTIPEAAKQGHLSTPVELEPWYG